MLERAMTTARTQKGSSVCVVPFFSLIIKDLYNQNESMSDKLSNGFIRFEVSDVSMTTFELNTVYRNV